MKTGLLFVHGIANGPEERASIEVRFHQLLTQYGVSYDAEATKAALWGSTGNFVVDLDKIYRDLNFRAAAINTVTEQAAALIEGMAKRSVWGSENSLVVVGHSMGQVLAYLLVRNIVDRMKNNSLPYTRLGFASFGGPLGNPNPAYRYYLKFAQKGPLVDKNGKEIPWVDVYNNDDPICCNVAGVGQPSANNPIGRLVGGLWRRLPMVRRYSPPENARSIEFSYPSSVETLIKNPLAEHSSYWRNETCFGYIRDMMETIKTEAH